MQATPVHSWSTPRLRRRSGCTLPALPKAVCRTQSTPSLPSSASRWQVHRSPVSPPGSPVVQDQAMAKLREAEAARAQHAESLRKLGAHAIEVAQVGKKSNYEVIAH